MNSQLPPDPDDDEEDEPEGGTSTPPPARAVPVTPFPTTEAMSVSVADAFLRREPCRVIAFVGDKKSGKTTLLCELYERFRAGPFAGQLFAGCRTVHGFERRSHPSRTDSGGKVATTRHTSRGDGLRFLHLALAPESGPDDVTNLLLADRAGETYKDALGKSDETIDLVEISKACCVVVMVDGERLASPRDRTSTLMNARQTLIAFSDAGILGKRSVIQMVTTKVDLLSELAEPYRTTLSQEVERFREQILRQLADRFRSLTFVDTAARPSVAGFPRLGLDSLLTAWINEVGAPPELPAVAPPSLLTQFDLLTKRTVVQEAS